MTYELFGKEISGRFTIPSGCVTTMPDTIDRIARLIPQIGLVTTKSIGPLERDQDGTLKPRTGSKEAAYAAVSRYLRTNNIGLANPGPVEYARELAEIYPLEGKFLLVSVYGKSPEDMQSVVQVLEPYCDGFELNFGCPHSPPHGATIGSSPELTAMYTKAIRAVTRKPLFVKLTPNVNDIGRIARAAIEAGANGIAAINTVGPLETPLLSAGRGGLSGQGIKDIGVRCARDIRRAVGPDVPMAVMGGIYFPEDVAAYEDAAGKKNTIIGVGTACEFLSTPELAQYFEALDSGRSVSQWINLDWAYKHMQYEYYPIRRIEQPADDLKIFYFDGEIDADPGQYVLAKVPIRRADRDEAREKPFSIADDRPLTLAVRKVGEFTSKMFELKEGDRVAVRGPYGKKFEYRAAGANCLVAGGTGLAPIHFLAKELSRLESRDVTICAGARSRDQLLFAKELEKYGRLVIATDDGSAGIGGAAVDALRTALQGQEIGAFFNCGPERMLKAAVELEKGHADERKIQALVERYMKCGAGICGNCSIDGLRACVDGPVFTYADLKDSKDFGVRRRDASGAFIAI